MAVGIVMVVVVVGGDDAIAGVAHGGLLLLLLLDLDEGGALGDELLEEGRMWKRKRMPDGCCHRHHHP